jgi:hypothetical protein
MPRTGPNASRTSSSNSAGSVPSASA